MKYVFKKKYLTVLMSALDIMGECVFKVFSRNIPAEADPERILLIRLDHIGDVMMATAVLGALREKYPDAIIDIMVPRWAYDIVEGNPYINNIVIFDPPWFTRKKKKSSEHIRGLFKMRDLIKEGRYDVAVDLRGDMRHITAMHMAKVPRRISYGITGGGFLLTDMVPYEGIMHEVDRDAALLSMIGAEYEDEPVPEIVLSGEDMKTAEMLKRDNGITGKYAVFHPVPGDSGKMRDMSIFRDAAIYLNEKYGIIPVLVGGSDDNDILTGLTGITDISMVDLSGKTSLRSLAALLKGAELFLGVDSGPSHIAAAVEAPSIVLFSETNDPAQWAPRGRDVAILCPGQYRDIRSAIDRMVKI